MPDGMSAENGEDHEKDAAKAQQDREISFRQSQRHLGGERSVYRPLKKLNEGGKDFSKLRNDERKEIKEVLEREIRSPFDALSSKLELIIEAQAARKITYSAQNDLERTDETINQVKENLANAKEGENETILGFTQTELIRQRSAQIILNWAIPYHTMAWSGMDSLRLISERGIQLPVADLSRFFKGAEAKWVDNGLKALPKEVLKDLPLVEVKETIIEKMSPPGQEVAPAGSEAPIQTPERTVFMETESFTDRLARYTSEAYFWNQIRGEMNTYNPAFGEKLNITKTMQKFVADLSKNTPRENENGSMETIKDKESKEITVFIRDLGKGRFEQVPQTKDDQGNVIALGKYASKEIVYINNLDYFNKTKSEDHRRWVVATTAAMCIHDAKRRLDDLPDNINDTPKDENNPETIKCTSLFRDVQNTAKEIMENYDVFSKSMMGQMMAKTAFNLSYSIAFGTFAVGDWGWSYDWEERSIKVKDEQENEQEGFLWEVSGSQGDPTSSGDAFTARRPYFHEAVYAGMKGRASAMNAGVMMPVNPKDANVLANVLLSEAEEINQRGIMIERIKRGEQPHLARFFGVIGAFEHELNDKNSKSFVYWQEGANIRNKEKNGKNSMEVNDNLKKAVETCVDFVPTPFIGADGKPLVYPVLMPQFQIALFDMLRVSDTSVGDVLRKTWKKEMKDEKEIWVEALPKEGGRRKTLQNIDWKQYHPYGDDGRAVNDNFISQIYAPLYGTIN